MKDEEPRIGKELAEFIDDLMEERYNPDYYEELDLKRKNRNPIKTFENGSELAIKVSCDIGAENSNISWAKVAKLPNREAAALFVERFRKNIFYVDSAKDNRLLLRFPLDGNATKSIPMEDYTSDIRNLNGEERRQLWVENDRERSMQKDKDTVRAAFPKAYLEKISDKNFFAVYSSKDPLVRKRLSLNPFEGKTATTRERAWHEAANKVKKKNINRNRGISY